MECNAGSVRFRAKQTVIVGVCTTRKVWFERKHFSEVAIASHRLWHGRREELWVTWLLYVTRWILPYSRITIAHWLPIPVPVPLFAHRPPCVVYVSCILFFCPIPLLSFTKYRQTNTLFCAALCLSVWWWFGGTSSAKNTKMNGDVKVKECWRRPSDCAWDGQLNGWF